MVTAYIYKQLQDKLMEITNNKEKKVEFKKGEFFYIISLPQDKEITYKIRKEMEKERKSYL